MPLLWRYLHGVTKTDYSDIIRLKHRINSPTVRHIHAHLLDRKHARPASFSSTAISRSSQTKLSAPISLSSHEIMLTDTWSASQGDRGINGKFSEVGNL